MSDVECVRATVRRGGKLDVFQGMNSSLHSVYNLVIKVGWVFAGMLCYSVHPAVQQVICSHEREGGWVEAARILLFSSTMTA